MEIIQTVTALCAFTHDTTQEICYYGCMEWITAKGWKHSDEKKNPNA